MDKLEVTYKDGELTIKPYGPLFTHDIDIISALTISATTGKSFEDVYNDIRQGIDSIDDQRGGE